LTVDDPVSFVVCNKSFEDVIVWIIAPFMFMLEYFVTDPQRTLPKHFVIFDLVPECGGGVRGGERMCLVNKGGFRKAIWLEVKAKRRKLFCCLSHQDTVVIICAACCKVHKLGVFFFQFTY